MTKSEARKVLSHVEETAAFVSQRVLDAIRVAITAIEKVEVMEALDYRYSYAQLVKWLKENTIKCECGGLMVKDGKCAVRCYPPMYEYICESCGKRATA
jgi:hypothetical protein